MCVDDESADLENPKEKRSDGFIEKDMKAARLFMDCSFIVMIVFRFWILYMIGNLESPCNLCRRNSSDLGKKLKTEGALYPARQGNDFFFFIQP